MSTGASVALPLMAVAGSRETDLDAVTFAGLVVIENSALIGDGRTVGCDRTAFPGAGLRRQNLGFFVPSHAVGRDRESRMPGLAIEARERNCSRRRPAGSRKDSEHPRRPIRRAAPRVMTGSVRACHCQCDRWPARLFGQSEVAIASTTCQGSQKPIANSSGAPQVASLIFSPAPWPGLESSTMSPPSVRTRRLMLIGPSRSSSNSSSV